MSVHVFSVLCECVFCYCVVWEKLKGLKAIEQWKSTTEVSIVLIYSSSHLFSPSLSFRKSLKILKEMLSVVRCMMI